MSENIEAVDIEARLQASSLSRPIQPLVPTQNFPSFITDVSSHLPEDREHVLAPVRLVSHEFPPSHNSNVHELRTYLHNNHESNIGLTRDGSAVDTRSFPIKEEPRAYNWHYYDGLDQESNIRVGIQSGLPAKVEEVVTDSRKRFTAEELHERDQKAVEYTKSMLSDGDTLVYITYPQGTIPYHPTGFALTKATHCVHSDNLRRTGSRYFSKMLEDWPQHRLRKRHGFLHGLPAGIKYILDLTPPDEGDEAVILTTDLSCSLGIRNWYKSEQRLSVAQGLVGGSDEGMFYKRLNDDHNGDEPDMYDCKESVDSQSGRKDREYVWPHVSNDDDFDLQKAIKLSMTDSLGYDFLAGSTVRQKQQLHTPGKNPAVEKDIPDYCPIRHRVGITRLLQVIEGRDPRLDSAPKVWTLVVLAKYFDCTRVVLDFVTRWIIAEPNCRFFEILPEASLKIGLKLENPMITRSGFGVLVSEEALMIASRRLGNVIPDKLRSNRFGRVKEDLDEDVLNSVQHAGQAFHDRVQAEVHSLLDDRGSWFKNCPEYLKICRFEAYLNTTKAENWPAFEKSKSALQELLVNLRHHVRGRLLLNFTEPLEQSQASLGNQHRQAEQYLEPFECDFADMYDHLKDQERIYTRFFWGSLRSIRWESLDSNHLRARDGSLYSHDDQAVITEYLNHHGVKEVSVPEIRNAHNALNKAIHHAQEKGNYGFFGGAGVKVPGPSTLAPATWVNLESTNHAFRSAYNPDHLYHQSKLAATAKRREDAVVDDGASISSSSSTAPLLNYPLRPKAAALATKSPLPNSPTAEKVNKFEDSDDQDMEVLEEEKCTPPKFPKLFGSIWESMGDKLVDSSAKAEANIPPDYKIGTDSPYFNLSRFMSEVEEYICAKCNEMLSTGELDFNIITDTLLCLSDDEWKYLPLWAGGNEDGSGGVYSNDIPLAPAGAGPSGPGPAFHTGFSSDSMASTEINWDDRSSVDTSLAVENGMSDHIDRRAIQSDDGFHSEGFSDDSEDYGYEGKGKGVAGMMTPTSESSFDTLSGDLEMADADIDVDDEENDDNEWEISDEDEAFDFGDDEVKDSKHV